MKSYPLGKYIISGDFGTGKTHFFWALYREAIMAGRNAWAGTALDLIREFQKVIDASQRGETYLAPFSVEDLNQQGAAWSIFLDDLDKARASEYVAEQLFAIFNACKERGHQIVITTNLGIQDLQEFYRRAGSRGVSEGFGQYGGSLVRRLLEKAFEIEMW